jgi:hypothetical protein
MKLISHKYANHVAKMVYNSSPDKDVLVQGLIAKSKKLVTNLAATEFLDKLPKRYSVLILERLMRKPEHIPTIAEKIIQKGSFNGSLA